MRSTCPVSPEPAYINPRVCTHQDQATAAHFSSFLHAFPRLSDDQRACHVAARLPDLCLEFLLDLSSASPITALALTAPTASVLTNSTALPSPTLTASTDFSRASTSPPASSLLSFSSTALRVLVHTGTRPLISLENYNLELTLLGHSDPAPPQRYFRSYGYKTGLRTKPEPAEHSISSLSHLPTSALRLRS